MNTSAKASTATRSRRRPATRSALHVLTVCTAAASDRTSAAIDSDRAPALASTGHVFHVRNTAKAVATMTSHSTPCQRRTTKSSSKFARAHSQKMTGLAIMIGRIHHTAAFGTNGAVTIA